MRNTKVTIIFALAIFAVGCSPASNPEKNLIGKWQSEATPKKTASPVTANQFEFFADGSVAYSEQISGKWHQSSAGTFKFVDKTHVKIELVPAWFYGAKIQELTWQDHDHISFQAGDTTMHLTRLK